MIFSWWIIPCSSSSPHDDNQCTKLWVLWEYGYSFLLPVSGTWEMVNSLFLSYPYQLCLYSDPTLFFLFRDLAPLVCPSFTPSPPFPVYLQYLPLFWRPPDSGWPGTVPVYLYCPSVIINSIHSNSIKMSGLPDKSYGPPIYIWPWTSAIQAL